MRAEERQLVLGQLASSEARLLTLLEGLTAAQWRFRESPERWSIAGNLEHLIVFEKFILGMIAKALEEPAAPEKKLHSAGKELLVLGLAEGRSTKFIAREAVRPVGRWENPIEMITEFQQTRAATKEFVTTTDAALRDHFFPHVAFGDLDCYQWLVVLGQHGARHAAQIEKIQADPAYPENPASL